MKVVITKDYQELSSKAARFVLAQIWRQPNSVLGLPTGSTPLGMYQKVTTSFKIGHIDFKEVVTFNLDEYWGIKASDPTSYHTYMRNNLFRHINVKKNKINIPPSLANDPKQAAIDYEKAIKAANGLDLLILGIGVNGHIGFNEPGTSIKSRTHLTDLSKETKEQNAQYFVDRKMPTQAMTMGLGTIMDAKKIVILASGSSKAETVARAVEGGVSDSVPASLLQKHKNVTWIIDEAAASKLKHSYRSPLLFTEGDIELLTESDLPRNKKIVVISPHPDDASISLGGVIWSLSRHNSVHVIVATTGYRSVVNGAKPEKVMAIREAEARQESKILGSQPIFLRAEFYDACAPKQAQARDAKRLVAYFKKIKPDIVFLPSHKDQHPTHRLSRAVALTALKQLDLQVKTVQLWEYEGPWSMFSEGDFNTIFAYDDKVMKYKLKAISLQRSQIVRTRFDIAAQSLARLRATVVPEQALVGYGAHPPHLGKYFELFNIVST